MVPCPALSDLEPLIGELRMELHDAAFLPDPQSRVTGAFQVDWIEDGAAIVMRQGHEDSPSTATRVVSRAPRGAADQVSSRRPATSARK
jgi:hypothetical protein